MDNKCRQLTLIPLCLAYGLLINANALCDQSVTNSAGTEGGLVESGSFPLLGDSKNITLYFHNFHPESDEAKRGLSYLYKSNILALKGGVSVHALQNVSKIPLLKSHGLVDKFADPAYQWRQYGYLPSPPSRKLGKIPGQAYFSLHMNVFPLGDNGLVPNENRGILTLSCLTCHSGVIAGQVVAGIGNNYADFRSYLDDNATLRILQQAIKLNPFWKSSSLARFGMTNWEMVFLDLELDYFDKVLRPMLKEQMTRGVITGPASTLTYLTRLSTNTKADSLETSLRDDTMNIMREDMELLPYPVPPADPIPWWNIKHKTSLYIYPENKGDSFDRMAENFMHRHIGVSDRNASSHHQIVKDVMHFVLQVKAPAYPWPLDPERVERGRQIFHNKPSENRGLKGKTCAKCHGSYQMENGKLSVDYFDDYSDVGTDPAVFEVGKYIMNKTLKRVDPAELSYYKPYEQRPGYPSTPLVGIWASAPYLHNGSVPTLYGLFKSDSRPTVWAKPFDPRIYDKKNAGIQAIDPGNAYDSSFVYDTRKPGYGNMGHDFGSSWDDETIYDVIEFLKSLSE